MNDFLTTIDTTEIDPRSDEPEVGRWYWVTSDHYDDTEYVSNLLTPEKLLSDGVKRWLGCVIEVGSNYVELQGVHRQSCRIHFDDFWTHCTYVPDPDKVIDNAVTKHQAKVQHLLQEVREVTALLSIGNQAALSSGGETAALATCVSSKPVDDYKLALIAAKDKTLPALFEQIKEENSTLGTWMAAKLIPLKAQASGLNAHIDAIKSRLFSVELYAGLTETVTQVVDGAAAALGEPVHLMQRRAYMDEEFIARYTCGGAVFNDIEDFDKWLAKPENLSRILPFQRCVVAFKVRRMGKDRPIFDISSYFLAMELEKYDSKTFLYLRNGEQLYRLNTAISFDEKLFPDMDRSKLTGKLWAYMRFGSDEVQRVVSDHEYLGLVEDERRALAEIEAKKAALPEEDRWRISDGDYYFNGVKNYQSFTKDNVHYDDIAKYVQGEIDKHNRIALILQGLLDRSPVFHPHPQWSIWTPGGFEQALRLVYDESRALTTGDKPDFEAYRAKLNASIKTGSITVGQDDAWALEEGVKETRRRAADYHNRGHYSDVERYRPWGNPGPGMLARVEHRAPRTKNCTFVWTRKRPGYGDKRGELLPAKFTTPTSNLLNVDAYKPGDFRIFFDDPRTRMEYLKWAPLLLEAEEYHAGNRKIGPVEEADE